jgi:hypothetical protein
MAPRLIAALPLFVFGSFHLTGRSPLLEILLRAGIPFSEINFYLAPVFMVLSGPAPHHSAPRPLWQTAVEARTSELDEDAT